MIELKMTFNSFEEAADAMMKMSGGSFDGEVHETRAEREYDAPEQIANEIAAAEKPKRTRRAKAEMEASTSPLALSSAPGAGKETSDTAGITGAASADAGSSADEKPLTAAEAEAVTNDAVDTQAERIEASLSKEEAELKFKTEVRPALQAIMGSLGQDTAREFLNGFKGLQLAKLSDLPVEHYDAFVAECKAKVA